MKGKKNGIWLAYFEDHLVYLEYKSKLVVKLNMIWALELNNVLKLFRKI